MRSELLPCPFCGCEAHISEWVNGNHFRYVIVCNDDDCRCGYNMSFGNYSDLQEAITAWNTRAERTCKMMKVHGDDGYTFVCSECNRPISYFAKDKYCPHCGAKVVE